MAPTTSEDKSPRRGDSAENQSTIADIFKAPSRINYLRLAVFASIILAAVSVGTFSYYMFRGFESTLFDEQYSSAASLLSDSIHRGLQNKIHASEGTATYFQYAFNMSDWPNVTLPGFDTIYSYQISLADLQEITFHPLIHISYRKIWESYARNNVDKLDGDISLIESINGSWPVTKGIYKINDQTNILSYDDSYDIAPVYPNIKFPIWQVSPMSIYKNQIMFNSHSQYNQATAIDLAMNTSTTTVSDVIHLEKDSSYINPAANMYSPILNPYTNASLGVIGVSFYWDSLFSETLPSYIVGVEVVLSTSTTKFTYVVNGGDVLLKGSGDLHDTQFNSYRQTTTLQLGNGPLAVSYTFEIYPTITLQNLFYTDLPMESVIVGVLLILSTAFVFFLYDYLVSARENVLASIAESRSTVINELFPSIVRNRLVRTQLKKPNAVVPVAPPSSANSNANNNTSNTNNSSNNNARYVIILELILIYVIVFLMMRHFIILYTVAHHMC